MTEAIELTTTYVHLDDGGQGSELPVTEDFWPSLMRGERQLSGRLVIASDLAGDTGHWEMHPAGEELLFLQSGSIEVVMERDGETGRVALAAGQACLVPRGAWHRVVVHEPGRLLFITYGEGTQHRPL